MKFSYLILLPKRQWSNLEPWRRWVKPTGNHPQPHPTKDERCAWYWWRTLYTCNDAKFDPSHKYRNALDKYLIMHHFVTEMCTHVHISVTIWCIMGYGTGALWDLWDWWIWAYDYSISRYHQSNHTLTQRTQRYAAPLPATPKIYAIYS